MYEFIHDHQLDETPHQWYKNDMTPIEYLDEIKRTYGMLTPIQVPEDLVNQIRDYIINTKSLRNHYIFKNVADMTSEDLILRFLVIKMTKSSNISLKPPQI